MTGLPTLSRRAAAAVTALVAAAGLLMLGGGTASATSAASAVTGSIAAPSVHTAATACKNSFGNPHTCSQAVAWAKAHITTTYHKDYYNLCDHVVGLAYGLPASGSVSAQAHWNSLPSSDKHAGVTTVPAGGLAFFKTKAGYGHVMISIGGGKFVSNDIGGKGTLTETTIAKIKSTWGDTYLGWGQPWFAYNH
jgi:hypothetical protein